MTMIGIIPSRPREIFQTYKCTGGTYYVGYVYLFEVNRRSQNNYAICFLSEESFRAIPAIIVFSLFWGIYKKEKLIRLNQSNVKCSSVMNINNTQSRCNHANNKIKQEKNGKSLKHFCQVAFSVNQIIKPLQILYVCKTKVAFFFFRYIFICRAVCRNVRSKEDIFGQQRNTDISMVPNQSMHVALSWMFAIWNLTSLFWTWAS